MKKWKDCRGNDREGRKKNKEIKVMVNKELINEIKNLITKKFTEDVQHLHDEQFSIKNKEYQDKLRDVERHGYYMQDKKVAAEKEIKDIKKQLAVLSAEHLKETDPIKIKDIEAKKKELRLKQDDLIDLVNTNISAVINGKYIRDLELPVRESQEEYVRFEQATVGCRDELKEIKDLIDGYMTRLNNASKGHLYFSNATLLQNIKTNRFSQDDGWISRRDFVVPGEVTRVYTGSSLED